MSAPQAKKRTFRLTVGTKLGGLISVLLILSVLGIVTLVTHFFGEYNTAQIQKITDDTATNLAVQMRNTFESATDKMRVFGTLLIGDDAKRAAAQSMIAKDTSFVGVFVHSRKERGQPVELRTYAVAESVGAYDGKDLIEKGLVPETILDQGESGNQVFVMQMTDGTSVLVLSIPFVKEGDRFTHTLTAVMHLDSIAKSFTELETVTGYMVDRNGTLVAHKDMSRATSRENRSNVDIVAEFKKGTRRLQKEYEDPDTHERMLGAFSAVGFGGLGVVAEVKKAVAFEPVRDIRRQSLLAAAVILFLSFMFGNYFSARAITGPILSLAEAAGKIAQGDFKISLKRRAKDEIGDLALTFNDMAAGLEERDKVKAVFNKFHNEAISKKLLSGEVKLGGERINATIFFSDVRGFTALSETLQPEEVVEMLNEYMSKMVSIINAHKGVVDKYVGDAIMALWGVPINGEDDTVNAVRACIEMRRALDELNTLRLSRGQGVLKIGMGLNRGEVIAGNIGSDLKMEYTVIGDAVNTASRIESMTKEYGTDLLISKSVHDICEGKFVFEQVKSAKVKGKTSALELHKVSGYYDAEGKAVVVQTPYSSYASEKSDKGVHEEKEKPEAGGIDPMVESASLKPMAAPLEVESEITATITGVTFLRDTLDEDEEERDMSAHKKSAA